MPVGFAAKGPGAIGAESGNCCRRRHFLGLGRASSRASTSRLNACEARWQRVSDLTIYAAC